MDFFGLGQHINLTKMNAIAKLIFLVRVKKKKSKQLDQQLCCTLGNKVNHIELFLT